MRVCGPGVRGLEGMVVVVQDSDVATTRRLRGLRGRLWMSCAKSDVLVIVYNVSLTRARVEEGGCSDGREGRGVHVRVPISKAHVSFSLPSVEEEEEEGWVGA